LILRLRQQEFPMDVAPCLSTKHRARGATRAYHMARSTATGSGTKCVQRICARTIGFKVNLENLR
jgi:hypothetical protein